MTTRQKESIRLPVASGGELAAYRSWSNPSLDWAVLAVHGFGSRGEGEKSRALEAACARRGWSFASIDFRGHGASTGHLLDLRGSTLLEDLATVREFLVSIGIGRLCLFGSSMGGWASAWFTIANPIVVSACVAVAPAFDFLNSRWRQLTEEERRHWRETGRLRVRNRWLDAEISYGLVEEIGQYPLERLIAEWSKPLLILHGMQDDVVPHGLSVAFAERLVYPEVEVRLYRKGDHRMEGCKEEVAEEACEFFARWVTNPEVDGAGLSTDHGPAISATP